MGFPTFLKVCFCRDSSLSVTNTINAPCPALSVASTPSSPFNKPKAARPAVRAAPTSSIKAHNGMTSDQVPKNSAKVASVSRLNNRAGPRGRRMERSCDTYQVHRSIHQTPDTSNHTSIVAATNANGIAPQMSMMPIGSGEGK